MSCAEALRRCPQAVFVGPRQSLYREYSREVWSIVREIVPTVEQAGIDEGYLDLGEVAPEFDDARALAEAVRAVVQARTRLSCSLGVATSKVVAKVASDRRKPGGLTVVRPGARRRSSRRSRSGAARASGRAPRRGSLAAGVETIGAARRARRDDELAHRPARQGRARVRDRARGIDPRPLEVSTERISISVEETFERDVADRERLHDELRRMAERLAEHLAERGQTARTVTTKLRYPDFAIRTRSTSLAVGTDDARPDRRARLLAARPRAPRPARPAAARRRRRLRPRRSRAARSCRAAVAARLRAARHGGLRLRDRDPRALRRDRRAGRRAQRELPGVVRGGARRVPRAVRGRLPAPPRRGVESLVLETHVRYLRPAVFDDRLLVHARCLDLRGARFRFEYAVERDGVVIADGWTAHGTVDATTLRPTRMPAWLAEAIVSAETQGQRRQSRRRLLLASARRARLGHGAVARVPGRVREQLPSGA